MIDPNATITYAQYNEDLILRALLHDVKQGFYVDVGANYPVIDSVTKFFYDSGWRGINIEPIKSLHLQLQNARPLDINLQYGAGRKEGEAVLREYEDVSGHSTFDSAQKKQHGSTVKYVDYKVPIKTLKTILSEHNVSHIEFIKIDVEGFEYEVVMGNDWQKYRPEVICIESNHMTHNWKQILKDNAYRLFISDGLNEYYIAQESWWRIDGFTERIIEIDYHALKQHQHQSWSKDSEDLVRLNKLLDERQATIKNLEHQIDGLVTDLTLTKELSLSEQPLRVRVKRAARGLTSDWISFKQEHRRPPEH